MRIKGHVVFSNPTNHEPSASAGEKKKKSKSRTRGAVNCGRPCDALGPLAVSFFLAAENGVRPILSKPLALICTC